MCKQTNTTYICNHTIATAQKRCELLKRYPEFAAEYCPNGFHPIFETSNKCCAYCKDAARAKSENLCNEWRDDYSKWREEWMKEREYVEGSSNDIEKKSDEGDEKLVEQ